MGNKAFRSGELVSLVVILGPADSKEGFLNMLTGCAINEGYSVMFENVDESAFHTVNMGSEKEYSR